MKETKTSRYIIGRFKSIQSSIFAAVSILVLFAVVIFAVVSVRYTQTSIFENSMMYTQTITRQINQNIDSYIDYMDNIAQLVSGSDDVQHFFRGDKLDKNQTNRIFSQFATILEGRKDIRNIGIISCKKEAMINNRSQVMNSNVDLKKLEWYIEAQHAEGESNLSSSHVQHVVEGERPWVITLSRGVGNFRGTRGVFFIDLNYSAISELCDQNSFGEKGYVFILDAEGNIVYHPQQQQLYNELQTENIDLVMSEESDTVTAGGKIYTLSRSEKTGWTVVGSMNTGELLAGTREAQGIYAFTAAALIIVALLLSSLIARTITMPIQKLRDSMAKVQEGNFGAADVEVVSENEVGSLTTSFNVMAHRIQELMNQNTYEQQEKRKSELKALQSQINPHFLYNTLDSIIWMAEGKKNEEVVLMTASLARLLRQSIGNEDELVSIGQEIEYCRSYLTIQKMRYKDKLEFDIDIAPEIKNVKIIKLVLQPIIENAIYHGLKYKESMGFLQVKGYKKCENAVIEIIDNGVGIDADVLNHIFEKHKVNYHSNGVGVYNVQKRLQLYYGSDYGISYTSVKGAGTVAAITIPVEQEESHETV